MMGRAPGWMVNLLAACWVALGFGVGTVRASAPGDDVSPEALMRRATAAERDGRAAEAAAAYEQLLRLDTAHEAIVAPRLIALYIQQKQAEPALAWALRAARGLPDPHAYLAGVHAQLGQWTEAALLLRQAARDQKEPGRRVALLWQLAEAETGRGDAEAALAALVAARDASPDETLRTTSTQRLDALRQRLGAVPPAPLPTPPEPKAEDPQ